MTAPEPQAGRGGGAEVEASVARLSNQFGPGFSNGVSAILLHDALPERFDKACWDEWFFKPADAAFEMARELGLIVPQGGSGEWSFTDLGARVSARLLSQTTREVGRG